MVVLIFFIVYFQALHSFHFGFLDYNILRPAKTSFVGFGNYIKLLHDPDFLSSALRSTYFVSIAGVAVMGLALTFALVLNETFKGRAILRTLVILPWAIPPVVNGFMWKWILDGQFGALNGILYQLGIIAEYQSWLKDPFTALNFASLTFIWRFTPFVTLILLGALQSIPGELYEAAKVDGAGALMRFLYITFPLIKPIFWIGLILVGIFSFTVFDEIYALTGLDSSTKTLMMYAYETIFERGRFGLGSALAYFIANILFLLTSLYVRSIRRGPEY
ncbi:carbohydrate ABC transporter permease [Candidatus Hakubella thermalkaliphila]|uniref:Multiple sugar transport system permease protein n=1 Tax=Candidatus Hakubella thermalkaliphila TaxID=2754717 RepID=A0A6V8P878_9ACTN|nr:sugar ABC transporter permease [Candidatus Hakubella thermalkaliphila]GFP27874.1 multiple sugar transport system permease protein [Candidatus Hakubella thermalkaliphila]